MSNFFPKNKVNRELAWSDKVHGKIKIYDQTKSNCLICQICNVQLLSPSADTQNNYRNTECQHKS